MSDELEDVSRALATLAELATPADRPAVTALRERLEQRRLRVLIAGEAKRGKSTLINRLLGRDVLPTGVTPVTAIATTVRRATEAEYVQVTFQDGRRERREPGELAALVTERENPENALGVADVVLYLRSPLLRDHDVELVDTPGTGSVFAHNTGAAEQAYRSLDAAVVVVSADPPISAAERDLLVRVDELAVRTFVVLNKIDQLDPADVREAGEFTRAAAEGALGRAVVIYPASARRGRDDAGFTAFSEAFRGYLTERAGPDLAAALRAHLARLAAAMLDAVLLTERSLQLAASSSADRVRLFADRVSAIADRRRDLGDRAGLVRRRVDRALTQSGQERAAQLSRRIHQGAAALLDGELADRPAEEFEAAGRAAVVGMIRDGVEGWRAEMAELLERELQAVCTQGLAELDAQLAELRQAAHELLDLELSTTAIDSPLRSSERFWYAFDRGVGWELPLHDLVQRALPGRKQRARRRVLDEIEPLVDRQVGRVRSDLAQRFRLSVEEVVRQLGAEHDEALDRVRFALAEVDRLRTAAVSERDERGAELTRRSSTLQELLGCLSSPEPVRGR